MKKLNLSSIGLVGAIIMFIIICCSCGTVKLSKRAKSIALINGAAMITDKLLSPETSNPSKTSKYIWASAASLSFTIAITDPEKNRERRWRKSLINK